MAVLAWSPFLTENSGIVLPLCIIEFPLLPLALKQRDFGDLLCQHQEIDSKVEFKIAHKLFSEDFEGRFSSRDAEKTGQKSYSCMEEKGGEGSRAARGDRSQRDGTETESNLGLRKKFTSLSFSVHKYQIPK